MKGQNITLEETDTRLHFSPVCQRANKSCDGGWTRWITPDGMNSSYRATYAPGSGFNFEIPSVTFKFNGTAIYYYTVTWNNTATASIRLDNNTAEIVDLTTSLGLNSNSPRVANVFAWKKEGLDPNIEHTWVMEYASAFNTNPGQSALRLDNVVYTDSGRNPPPKGVPAGAVVGGVVGSLVLIGLAILGVMFWYKRKQKRQPVGQKRVSVMKNWAIDDDDDDPAESSHAPVPQSAKIRYASVPGDEEEEFGSWLHRAHTAGDPPTVNAPSSVRPSSYASSSSQVTPPSLTSIQNQDLLHYRPGRQTLTSKVSNLHLEAPHASQSVGHHQSDPSLASSSNPKAPPIPPHPAPDLNDLQMQQRLMLDVIHQQNQRIEELQRGLRQFGDRGASPQSAEGMQEHIDEPWERRPLTNNPETPGHMPPPYVPPPGVGDLATQRGAPMEHQPTHEQVRTYDRTVP